MTVALTKPPNRKPQVTRHIVRRHRLKSNPSLGKMPQKVIGVAAVIVDRDPIVSLLRQRILQFGDRRTCFMRDESLLDCF